MEQWEIDLREKLEKDVKPGMYEIGYGDFVAWTGKGGWIDYEVELRKAIMEELKLIEDNTKACCAVLEVTQGEVSKKFYSTEDNYWVIHKLLHEQTI